MRNFMQLLAESLWPTRPKSPANGFSWYAFLRPFIILVIVLLVGPDLFAYVELSTLLELLGSTLFLVAFAVGYRMLGVAVLKWLHRLLVPAECSVLIGSRRPFGALFGLVCVAANCAVLLGICVLSYVDVSALLRLVT
jgi:hypothetical protein